VFILFIPFDVFGHTWIYSCFGFIFNPFTYEYFTPFRLEIGPLAFLHVIHPMSFLVVPIPPCQHALTRLFAVVPLAFVYIPISLNHSALSVWHIFKPIAVLPWAVFHPQCSFARPHILFLLTHLLFEHLTIVFAVVGAKAMFFVIPEVALVSVAIREC